MNINPVIITIIILLFNQFYDTPILENTESFQGVNAATGLNSNLGIDSAVVADLNSLGSGEASSMGGVNIGWIWSICSNPAILGSIASYIGSPAGYALIGGIAILLSHGAYLSRYFDQDFARLLQEANDDSNSGSDSDSDSDSEREPYDGNGSESEVEYSPVGSSVGSLIDDIFDKKIKIDKSPSPGSGSDLDSENISSIRNFIEAEYPFYQFNPASALDPNATNFENLHNILGNLEMIIQDDDFYLGVVAFRLFINLLFWCLNQVSLSGGSIDSLFSAGSDNIIYNLIILISENLADFRYYFFGNTTGSANEEYLSFFANLFLVLDLPIDQVELYLLLDETNFYTQFFNPLGFLLNTISKLPYIEFLRLFPEYRHMGLNGIVEYIDHSELNLTSENLELIRIMSLKLTEIGLPEFKTILEYFIPNIPWDSSSLDLIINKAQSNLKNNPDYFSNTPCLPNIFLSDFQDISLTDEEAFDESIKQSKRKYDAFVESSGDSNDIMEGPSKRPFEPGGSSTPDPKGKGKERAF